MQKTPHKIIYLRIPTELQKKLKAIALIEFRTVSSVIRAALENYVNGGK